MRKPDLKITKVALICAVQEQAIRMNYIKYNIEKTAESPTCRLCKEKGEIVSHIVSDCKKLAQTDYKRRHGYVAGNSKALESSKSLSDTCYCRSSWKCNTQFQEIYRTNRKRVRDPFCTKTYY